MERVVVTEKNFIEAQYKYKCKRYRVQKELQDIYKKQLDELVQKGMNIDEADEYLYNQYKSFMSVETKEKSNLKKAKIHLQTHLNIDKPVFEINRTMYQVQYAEIKGGVLANLNPKNMLENKLVIGLKNQNDVSQPTFELILNFRDDNKIYHQYNFKNADNIINQSMNEHHDETHYPLLDRQQVIDTNFKEYKVVSIQEYEHIFLEDIKQQIKYIHEYLKDMINVNQS